MMMMMMMMMMMTMRDEFPSSWDEVNGLQGQYT